MVATSYITLYMQHIHNMELIYYSFSLHFIVLSLYRVLLQVTTSFIHVLMFKQTTQLAKANLKFVETPNHYLHVTEIYIFNRLTGLIKDILVALSQIHGPIFL